MFINELERFGSEMQDFIVNKDEQMQKNILTHDNRKCQIKTAIQILEDSVSVQ